MRKSLLAALFSFLLSAFLIEVARAQLTFTRTVSGNWTDTTGWTPNADPNGTTVTAQLVNPGSGTNNVNLGGGTFTLNQLQFSGTNSGTWNVTNGTIIFDGTNPTFLNQGDSSGLVGTLPSLQLNVSTTFEIDNASAVTEVTGTISGTGGLTKTGSGALVLIGINTFTGGTIVNAGTLQLGDGIDTASLAGNNGSTGSTGNPGGAGTGAVTVNNSAVLNVMAKASITGGAGGKGGPGLANAGNGGNGGEAVSFSTGGSLTNSGTLSGGAGGEGGLGGISAAGNGGNGGNGGDAVSFSTGGSLTNSGTLSGGAGGEGGLGGLDAAGSGGNGGNGGDAVSFSTGGSLTNSGTLSGGAGGEGGLGGLTAAGNGGNGGNGGDAVSFSTGGSLTNSGTLSGGAGGEGGLGGDGNGGAGGSGGAAVSFSAGGSLTNSGTISGGAAGTAGPFGDVNGTAGFGVLFSGAAGTLTNQSGGVINGGVMMGNFANAVTLDTGSVINGILNIGTSTFATLTLDGTATQLYSTAVTGATTFDGALIKNGTGTWTLNESFTYTGGTTINAGTLQIGAGGTTGSIVGNMTDNGVFAINRSDTYTFAGNISGTGVLEQLGTGTTILTADNTYTGGTIVNAGTLQLGDGGVTGSILGNVTDNGTLAFDRSDAVTIGVVVSGTGGLVQLGSGTLILTGVETFAGGTIVDAGTLQLGDGIHTASLAGANGSNGSPGGAGTDAVTVNNSATFNVMTNASVSGGAGGDSAGLTHPGNGGVAVSFSAGGSLTNRGTISGGAGGAAAQIANGGNGGAAVSFSAGGSLTNSGTISGGAAGTKGPFGGVNGTAGFGVLFSGAAGTLTNLSGGVINGGVMMGNFANAVTLDTGSVINGTLNIGPSTAATLTLDGTGTQLYSTAVTGATTLNGALIKNGTGTWTLDESFTYSGGTTINAGTLQIGNGVTAGSITGDVANNATLEFDRSDSVTFGGAISGVGSLVQLGSGTLILTANNPYTGGTTISAGTLQLGNGGTSGSITGNVTDNGTLAFDRSDAVTFAGAISGAGNVTQIGIGTTILTGTNTYGGGTTISSGTLQIGNGGTSGSITGNVSDNGVLAFDRSDTVTFAGVIAGAGGVTQIGTGTTILTGTNTYGGATTVNAGTLALGSGGSIASSSGLSLAASGAGFDISAGGNQTIQDLSGVAGSTINLGANTLTVGTADSTSFAGVISGTGGLTKQGTGRLILSANNPFTGTTTISAGTLQLGTGGTTGGVGSSAIIDNGVLDFDHSDTVTYAGVVSGTGSGVKDGIGTLILLGANTYAGGTTINSGTLQIGNGTTTGSIVGNVIDNAALVFDRSDGVTFNGAISGTGSLTQSGTGSLTLSGANTYMGATTIDAGTLALGLGGSIASSSGLTLAASGTGFDISAGGNQTIQGLSGVAGSTINLGANTLTAGTANSTSFAGVISGTGGFIKQGTGTLTLSGTNAYTGATTVNAGTLALGSGGSIASSSGLALATSGAGFDISAGGNQTIQDLSGVTGSTINLGANTLTAGTANSTSFAGVISGTGGFIKQGGGTLTLSGANTYMGATTVNAGTLALGSGGSIASSSGLSLAVSGAGFDISAGGNQTVQDLSGVAGSMINLGANMLIAGTANSTSFAGVISGTGGFIKQGGGTLTLSGAETYSGATTVNAGTLALGSGGSIASSSGLALAISGAGFDISAGGNQTIQDLTGVAGSTINLGVNTLIAGTANSTSFAGVISGTGGFIKQGTGTLILTGNNTYSGGTSFNGGIVAVDNDGNLGTGALSFNAGTLEALAVGGGITSSKAITLDAGGGTFLADAGTTSTLSGVISGVGLLTKDGLGTLILTGANIYTGGTTINAGTLQIGNGGTSGSIAGDVSDNATFAFNRSDSVTFGGVISGTGALVQIGSGTLTLTADNSYGGGTTINTGATLQLGNGGTTGSIIGNVNDNGSLIFNRSDNVTFNSLISGAGNLVQNGSGTTILGGANTYSGGTIINNGTLLVNNSRALGLGNVVVNGGTLGADPQPINVKGNYAQNAGGTLQLQVAGANPGQYDTLNVGGNAALGGTLQLISLGFQPKAGNQLTLVTSGGAVSGQFARFVDPFSVNPGLNTIDLIYGKQSVVLEFLNQTTPVSPVIPTVPTVPTSPSVVPPIVIATINFASFALTPNQLAAANLLDAVQLNPRAANLISFLDKVPFANLPSDFERISPDGLTAFYEISFSNANIQRLNLEGRMDDLHNGSTGFSSNMKVNGGTVNLENRADADGKSSKAVATPVLQPVPENRWGVWVTGFGDFVSVDADANANGYNFTTGGVSLGIDYRITDQLAIGVMGEYSHTWTTLQPGGNIDVNSGRGGVYATWSYHGIYLNAAIYGGYNSYDSSRSVLGGLARGNTEGAELSTFISGGYDFHFGPLTVGPIAALQYTYANVDGFSENGSLAPMQIQSDSVDSLRSDVGFRIFYQWQIGKILVEPSLKAAWEHEYLYSALPVTASFAGIPGPSATFFGPNEGHDSAIVSAGVSVQWTPMISTYVNYDGQLGRGNYDSNAVTGGFRISF